MPKEDGCSTNGFLKGDLNEHVIFSPNERFRVLIKTASPELESILARTDYASAETKGLIRAHNRCALQRLAKYLDMAGYSIEFHNEIIGTVEAQMHGIQIYAMAKNPPEFVSFIAPVDYTH